MKLSAKDKIKGLIIPNEINEDLAYFCGVLAGDGNIDIRLHKHDYTIKCVGNPRDEKEYYNKVLYNLIYKIFNIKIKPGLKHKNTTYGFTIHSKALILYLTEFIGLPKGRKYNKLKIPTLFKEDINLIKAFIQGVVDTDFGLSFKKRNNKIYPVLAGASNTRSFIEEISEEFNKLGIKNITNLDYKVYDERFKKGYSIINTVEINGYKRLKKFVELINFRHPKNLNKIRILKSIGARI